MIYGKKKQLQGHFERGLMSADISAFAFKCSNQVLIQPMADMASAHALRHIRKNAARD